MATHAGELPLIGTVSVTAKLNIRQAAPLLSSPVIGKALPGDQLSVSAVTSGDAVQGNRLWYRLTDNSYVWSGACAPLVQASTAEVGAVAPFPPAMVVDLYHYDGVSSFAEAKAAGVAGIIHKASTGGTGRDDQYSERRPLAEAAGLLWGAYHFGTAAPAAKQVDNFLAIADPDHSTLVALDFEELPGNQMTLDIAREFLVLIEQKLKRKAVVYGGHMIKNLLGVADDPFFGGHRLWLAQYDSSPTLQASWGSYWLWQFTEGKASDPRRRTVPGILGNTAGEIDCNYFAGDEARLRTEWAQ